MIDMTDHAPAFTLARDSLRQFIDAHFDEQVSTLAELVRCPSDNPPGDCAPHA